MYNSDFLRQKIWIYQKKGLSLRQIYNCLHMLKKLLILVAVVSMGFSIPTYAVKMKAEMGIAELVDEQSPTISINKNTITVQGGNGMVLEVVSLTGRAVASYKIESPVQKIELNLSKGCYILKVGKTVRKVTLR